MNEIYKIFKVTYFGTGWWGVSKSESFFYIAKDAQEVVNNSKKYAEFAKMQKSYGGDISVNELTTLPDSRNFENLSDFEVNVMLIKKDPEEDD